MLFNLLCRSKADESESDITYQFDLDSSFKRMLDEKRQMTNKENNPPAAAEQAATSINPPEKPLRKDLLKERKFWLWFSLDDNRIWFKFSNLINQTPNIDRLKLEFWIIILCVCRFAQPRARRFSYGAIVVCDGA